MKKWLGLLILCVALVGCSTQFIYRNIDWFVIDYLEDYVDLTDQQEKMISDSVAHLSQWHRQVEIPKYVAHIDQLLTMDPSQFSLEEFHRQRRIITSYTQNLLRKAEPDIERITALMSDKQVDELMSSVRQRHSKFKQKFAPMSDEQIRKYYYEQISDNLEDWLGELTDKQRQLLKEWKSEMKVTKPEWIDQQTRMRIELKTLLARRLDHDYFSRQFETMLLEPESFFSAELKTKNAYNQALSARYLVDIIRAMTPKQTEHVRSELNDWKEMALEVIDSE